MMLSRTCGNVSYNLNNYELLKNRELGFKRHNGYDDDISKKLYSNMDAYQSDIPLSKYGKIPSDHGGIFNLEFSQDGSILIAACEERSVLMFDASNSEFIHKIGEAHQRCVNCVKFLDAHTFATCSDDGSIKLWDTRKTRQPLRTLCGHSNWVKNIEYSEKEKLMVTSSFDGSIFAWDLCSPTENNLIHTKVFHMSCLMRTKLTPDCSKLIIATTNGYMIIIHDLNLASMASDMRTFRPNLYRLMQFSEQTFPAATMYNYLFDQTRKRNRVEFIEDFPNDAEVISSIQVHPMGWSVLSRNVNSDDDEECTCVHDIQTRDPKDYEEAFSYVEESALDEPEDPNEPSQNVRAADIWMGFISNEQVVEQRSMGQTIYDNDRGFMGVLNSGLIAKTRYDKYFRRRPEDRYRILKNLPRLTNFVKEMSVGRGYIKELCFSTDGRLVCSPYNKGVRLLGFNEHLQELSNCVPNQPTELFTLAKMEHYHPNVVVSCKFNPRHYQLVSGCLGGHIVWYKPIL